MMRIAVITPHYRPVERGNAVTVDRLARYLRGSGCVADIFSLDERGGEEIAAQVAGAGYDLCHAFHAWHGGVTAGAIKRRSGIPYLITLTGSDLYEALADARRDATLAALTSAEKIVAFHADMAARLLESASLFCAERIAVIPQGVELPSSIPESFTEGEFVFLLPAGLRPVKDVQAPLSPLSRLYAEDCRVRFMLAGPILDSRYAETVCADLSRYPFARYLGAVEHHAMGELYRRAQVVVNSSRFEGGMANSILEAMAWGKPVLASDIEGNRSLITDGVNGLLYRDDAEFFSKAGMLLRDADLRSMLGRAGRDMVALHHAPQVEAARYLELYRAIAARRRSADS